MMIMMMESLQMTGKEMNFLLLRNGMTRISPTSFHSTIQSSSRPISQQFLSNRPDQHVHLQQQQQQPTQIPSTVSKQQPQHAVFQPPPPNFKPNIAIENNLEFDLQSDSSSKSSSSSLMINLDNQVTIQQA